MTNHRKLEHGFGIVGIVIIVVALATVGGVGWFTYDNFVNNESDNSESNSTNNKQVSQKSPAPEASPEATEATGTVITTGDSDFGKMLFDKNEQAIYIWEVEKTEKPECYGDCAVAWPPVLTDGEPQADGDVKESLLGTTKRSDGKTQVTYNGHPLYYYAHEEPGEVKCHNVSTHGGLWWVIQPNGNRAS